MKKSIWKFQLEVLDMQEVQMPKGAKILTAQAQGDIPCLWAEVDAEEKVMEIRTIEIIGTGHTVEDANRQYIGTVQLYLGAFIWHIYELVK